MNYISWYKIKNQLNPKGKSFFEWGGCKEKKNDSELYLRDCIAYVELNALKHQLVDDPQQWAFTSWNGGEERKEILILDWGF